MDNPRADKVAVVDEVRERLAASDGAVLTEYRGLTVAALANLRRELAAAGGDYKVYKNTLVRLAVANGPKESIRDLLTGPTAIAFVQGDVSAVAKTLRDFAKANPNLVVKGGIVGDGLLSASEMTVLADLPPRQTLLAQFAGALSAPMQQLAGLLEALPRNLAYGISALLDQKRSEGGGEAPAPAAEAVESAPVGESAPAETSESPAAEAVESAPAETSESPAAEAADVPAEEASAE
jgi:large subunit ribosomal protein L10